MLLTKPDKDYLETFMITDHVFILCLLTNQKACVTATR